MESKYYRPVLGVSYSTTPQATLLSDGKVHVLSVTGYGYKTGQRPDVLVAQKIGDFTVWEETGERYIVHLSQEDPDIELTEDMLANFCRINPSFLIYDRLEGKHIERTTK